MHHGARINMEYTEALKESLSNAYHEAAKRRHEYVTLEHVLYALIDDETCKRIILACGGEIEKLRKDLEPVRVGVRLRMIKLKPWKWKSPDYVKSITMKWKHYNE